MKLQIEVHVPEDFDAVHALNSVTDALRLSDNVTEQESVLAEYFFLRIKELLDAAKPKMKKFNVIYYGVVEALNEDDARHVANELSPSSIKIVMQGYEGSYKYVSNEVHDCVPEDTKLSSYVVDGYYNRVPFSVFYNQKIWLMGSELNEALIPDNPKSNITITKIHK